MERSGRLVPTRALELRITHTGALVAQTSISGATLSLTPDLLLALLSFAGGVDDAEALGRLEQRFGVEKDAFDRSVDVLVQAGLLVGVGSADAPSVTGFFADVLKHVMMLADATRVRAYAQALAVAAPGKRVVDLGTGTGLLAILASRAGAARVIAIEESAIADMAAQVIAAANAEVTLVRRSSHDVDVDPPADLIVHELLGSDPLAEALLPTLCDARRRMLAPDGRLLPYRLEILCVGVDTRGVARDRATALAELAGVEGMADALAPLSDVIGALPARAFVTNLGDIPFDVVTEPVVLHDLDLLTVAEDACAADVSAELVVTAPGRLDAVVTYFHAHLVPGLTLSNAPGAPPTHWDRRVTALSAGRRVRPGERVAIRAWRESALKHEQILVDVAG
jgi:hypothetical protein